MYLRFTQRANADGTVVRYVALAHNRRVNGQTKPDVLMNLGRVDHLDVDGLRRLAASSGCCWEPWPGGPTAAAPRILRTAPETSSAGPEAGAGR
jgi:hypothetical protein